MKKPTCYKCDKEFSSWQRLDYHCRNNVCTGIIRYIGLEHATDVAVLEKKLGTIYPVTLNMMVSYYEYNTILYNE